MVVINSCALAANRVKNTFCCSISLFTSLTNGTLRACLANKKWSLNFHHSSLITHHSIFHIRLPSSLSFHYSLFFTLFGGPTPVIVQLFFFFFSSSFFFSFFFPSWVGCSVLFFFFSLSLVSLGTKEKRKKKKNRTEQTNQ